MYRVAITGGFGFIGKHLVERCVESGWHVHVLSRTSRDEYDQEKVTFFKGDLTDSDIDLKPFLSGVDCLFHCAAELTDTDIMHELHVHGTQRLIAAIPSSLSRWVQLSSVGVFGVQRKGVVTEDSVKQPVGEYEKTKLISDQLVKAAADERNFDLSVIMPSNVFGNDMPNQSLAQMLSYIRRGLFFYVGSKQARVNYVSVSDVVSALHCMAKQGRPGVSEYIVSQSALLTEMIYGLAQGVEVKAPWLRLPEAVARSLGYVLEKIGVPLTQARLDALTCRAEYSAERIKKDFGFEFEQCLENGMKEYAAYVSTISRDSAR